MKRKVIILFGLGLFFLLIVLVGEIVISPTENIRKESTQALELNEENEQLEFSEVENNYKNTEESAYIEKTNEKLEIIRGIISEMTLEEKVAQVFMITPESLTGYSMVTEASEITREALKKYPVGGVIFFSNNIVSPEQTTEMLSDMQTYAEEINNIPLFLAVDEEGGIVTRIAQNRNFDVPVFQNMREIGETQETFKAYEAGYEIGKYLNEYGFNVDFAPVADVITNSQNQVVKDRAFGTDAKLVSEMSLAYLNGLNEHDVFGCLKHFPGHGATADDTHNGFAYADRTMEEIIEKELIPFQDGIDNGVSFIMVSHISLKQITGDDTPASLSEKIVTQLLRNKMGYEGIIITDAMNMSAIVEKYDSEEATIKAFLAGADMILIPQDFPSAYHGMIEAVESGVITEERLDESLERILMVKFYREERITK